MQRALFQRNEYQRVHVETANPGRVLLTLYQAAIRFVELGKEQIIAGDFAGKGISLGRAHDIIAEFINALDHKMSPALCSNLEQIYIFMLDRIFMANHQMNADHLEPVLVYLNDLYITWEQAVNEANIEEARKATSAGM
ncbi:MAG: flagellar export chaperone FliS [Deltaproteobacteria bacterium]|nr:flagellar export chaperone FliS [Deltaproteobacteria bacterium]